MNNRNFISVAVLLFGLAGCASGDPEIRALYSVLGQDSLGSSEAWLERGRKEYAANRCGLAIRHFRNALNRKPDSVSAMNGMGACYDKMKRFDLSERFYRAALVQDPLSAQTLNNLGYSYYLQNKPDLAVGYLQEAKRLAAQDPLVENNIRLAEIALNKKQTASNNVNKVAFKSAPLSNPALLQSTSVKKVRMVRTGKSRVSLLTRLPNLEWQAAILQQPLPLQIQKESPVATEPTPSTVKAVNSVKTSNSVSTGNGPQPIKAVLRVAMDEYLLTASAMTSNPVTNRKEPQPIKAVLRVVPDPVPTNEGGVQNDPLGTLQARRGFSIEVSNGTGRRRMAARVRDYLVEKRQDVRWLTNAKNFSIQASTIFYKPGAKAAAERLATTLPVTPRLLQRETQRAALQLELGGDLLSFDKKLIRNNDYVTRVPDNVKI